MSRSHCTFWVTSPRLAVRLRNTAMGSSGSPPARSRARMCQKNRPISTAPATSRMAMRAKLSSAASTPITTRTRPAADSTAPTLSKGCVRSAGRGSTMARLSHRIKHDDERLEHEGGAPTDGGGDEAADQGSGGGADAAHPGDDAEGLGPGRHVGEQDRGEDVDGWDQQRGADAFEDRVAEDQHAEPLGHRAHEGADPVEDEPDDEAPLATPAIGQLAARDHEGGHHEQEDGDRRLDALNRGVQILADVVDHHVHVRAGEAADELGQRQREEDPAQRTRRPADAHGFSHGPPYLLAGSTTAAGGPAGGRGGPRRRSARGG